MHIYVKRSLLALTGSMLIGSLAFAGTALAAEPNTHGTSSPRAAVTGTVVSVSGNTLTITAKSWKRDNTSTTPITYTVNAANATVMSKGAVSTVSAIAIGDLVMVQGTIVGTTVTATKINDVKKGRTEKPERRPSHKGKVKETASSTPQRN